MSLDRVPIPDERGAEERAWPVVRAAWEERLPAPRERRVGLRVAAAAACVAVVAAAVTSPGRAVLSSVRDAVVGERHARTALFSLPAAGDVLVDSADGPWVVHPDGSKRLLGRYTTASWSPHGLFVLGVRRDELTALEPGGRVHWTLARPDMRAASWGGTRTDTRIAYVSSGTLHVVAGNDTGDHVACARADADPVAPAWRPGPARTVAYVDGRGRVVVLDVTTCAVSFRFSPQAPRALAWSADGRLLLVTARDGLWVFRRRILTDVVSAAFAPRGSRIAAVRRHEIVVLDARNPRPRKVFGASGPLSQVAWSPDGRWLLAPWRAADQWIFVQVAGGRRVRATSSITDQFGGSFPTISGWCCG